MSDTRRRWLLLAAGAAVLALTAVRGPVVLAAASAVGLAVVAYRLAGPLAPSRPDWSWGDGASPVGDTGWRTQTLAALLDPQEKDPHSPERLQQWFRRVAAARGPAAADDTASSALGAYLAGPPRRLRPHEVEQLLTDLDPS